MKKLFFLFIGFMFIASLLNAQMLTKKFTWKDNSITTVDLSWVDIDNDSHLDVLLLGQSSQQSLKLIALKNNLTSFTANPPIQQNILLKSFCVKDINHDRKADLVLFGSTSGQPVTTALFNNGNFQFSKTNQGLPTISASATLFVDLDNDGKEDLITAESGSFKIFKAGITYLLKLDSSNINIESLSARDFTKDGLNDIIISGSDKNGNPFLQLLKNKGKFKFQYIAINNPVKGKVESGDFNHDGWFDFVVAGKNRRQIDQISYFTNNQSNFTATDSIVNVGKSNLLLADLDSDGLVDLSFQGKRENGKKFNAIKNSNGTLLDIDTTGLITQRWGDYDRDGDLDLLTIKDSVGYKVVWIYEYKTTEINKRPKKSGISFAISLFNKTILYWGGATDDKTPSSALTFDVYLGQRGNSQSVVNPEFDFERILVTHGNQTTNNFAIVNNLSDDRYSYLIQPIDNAFNGAERSECHGGGGDCGCMLSCFDIKHDYVQACQNENILLTASSRAYWFSTTKGFLEIATTHQFIAIANDTIYSVVPESRDCAKNNIWVINVNGVSKKEKEIKYVCEDISIKLGINPGWEKVLWTWGGSKSTKDTVEIKFNEPQLVKVEASSLGCTYSKEFDIKISKPELSLPDNHFLIRKGETVQLNASGMKKYLWSPVTGLDNSQVPNPNASPLQTTDYTLQATDSIGCNKTGAVTVEVIETAFLPTLFTPNGDGKNDELKILGLHSVQDFSFAIYNREGNIVFETTDWSLASSQGWNGSKAGSPQPSGLYYWKIGGRQNGGQSIQLNGKTNGSVLLVR